MSCFKTLWRKIAPNPLDQRLRKVRGERILITWNRGLGDIPLGLYALVHRIREFIPKAQITFLTRQDLQDGFSLLYDVTAVACVHWRRGVAFDLDDTLAQHQLARSSFDLILENPDPTYWVNWQLGSLVPRLKWDQAWDALQAPFLGEGSYIGVHVQTETVYGYEKNWPLTQWRELFSKLTALGFRVLLFGFQPTDDFVMGGVTDLRGRTNLFEMLSIIKNRCTHLIVPDSGVLSLTYYLDVQFPIRIVSLWADPRQGVLKQNVPSPNKALQHIPLLGRSENLSTLSVEEVMKALEVLC